MLDFKTDAEGFSKHPAVVIKEITGSCIPTIPVGTRFTIVCYKGHANTNFSAVCEGLPISLIWLNEFEYVNRG